MEKHWIQTFTGKRVCPLCMTPDDVDILDIAHALSLINRFTGHTPEPYSVAQHSVLVSNMCSRENAMWGLLHDATEAYITDISRPLKLCIMDKYGTILKDIERHVMDAVCLKFDLTKEEPEEVKLADNSILAHEAWSFFGHTENYKHWKAYHPDGQKRFGYRIKPMDWHDASSTFLIQYTRLDSERKTNGNGKWSWNRSSDGGKREWSKTIVVPVQSGPPADVCSPKRGVDS